MVNKMMCFCFMVLFKILVLQNRISFLVNYLSAEKFTNLNNAEKIIDQKWDNLYNIPKQHEGSSRIQ